MTERIIKLPTWEESSRTIIGSKEDTAISAICYFSFHPAEPRSRERLAAALTEAARMGAEVAKEGKEVRYEP
jgi:hypothetical protein